MELRSRDDCCSDQSRVKRENVELGFKFMFGVWIQPSLNVDLGENRPAKPRFVSSSWGKDGVDVGSYAGDAVTPVPRAVPGQSQHQRAHPSARCVKAATPDHMYRTLGLGSIQFLCRRFITSSRSPAQLVIVGPSLPLTSRPKLILEPLLRFLNSLLTAVHSRPRAPSSASSSSSSTIGG